MRAQDLHAIVQPLFEKHPSTKPEGVNFKDVPWTAFEAPHFVDDHNRGLYAKSVERIFVGHLAQWLAEKGQCPSIWGPKAVESSGRGWVVNTNAGIRFGPTLLEALCAACMEVAP
jgi:Fe-S-cluster formation regulator IscX/YfhJ